MEVECANVYASAGIPPTDDPPALATLCQRILRATVQLSYSVLKVTMRRDHAGKTLLVPAHLSDADARFATALAVAEHWLKRRSIDAANASRLAGALLCPRPSFLRVVDAVGYDVSAIAECFGVTETVALLRIGEVTGQPVVLSDRTSNVVHVRGRREPGLRPIRMQRQGVALA